MTLKAFISIMVLSTLAAWAAWAMVLFKVDPFGAGWLGFVLFYVSFWLAMTGTVSLVGLAVRAWLRRQELIFRHVSNSFRQGMFLSFLVVGILFFQGYHLLTWWNASFLVLAATLLEFFWLSYSGRRR